MEYETEVLSAPFIVPIWFALRVEYGFHSVQVLPCSTSLSCNCSRFFFFVIKKSEFYPKLMTPSLSADKDIISQIVTDKLIAKSMNIKILIILVSFKG